MLKIKDQKYIAEMGFVKDEYDYVYREMIDGSPTKLFTVYAGSLYLRHAKTSYSSTNQLRCIYEWAKKDYIEWEEQEWLYGKREDTQVA